LNSNLAMLSRDYLNLIATLMPTSQVNIIAMGTCYHSHRFSCKRY